MTIKQSKPDEEHQQFFMFEPQIPFRKESNNPEIIRKIQIKTTSLRMFEGYEFFMKVYGFLDLKSEQPNNLSANLLLSCQSL